MTVSNFKSFFFKSFDDFRCSVFLINGKMSFSFMESNVWWKDILSFQQSFLDILEWNGLLFLDSKSEDDRFYFIIWIIRGFVFFFWFDFLFRFEFWEVVKIFSSNHGFISIEFKLIIIDNSINNLLNFVGSEFFNFVTVEEKW